MSPRALRLLACAAALVAWALDRPVATLCAVSALGAVDLVDACREWRDAPGWWP